MAIIQTVRMRRIRDYSRVQLWGLVSSLNAQMRNFEHVRLESAYQGSLEMFRTLLCHLAMYEKSFDSRTIEMWRLTNKISTDWQQRQAQFLVEVDRPKNGGQRAEVDMLQGNHASNDATADLMHRVVSAYRKEIGE